MKKILNSLLLLSLLLVLNVKADMGPPMMPSIELEVSNPDGAKCYESEEDKVIKTFKYGEIVTIREDEIYDDKYKNDYYAIEEENTCYVKKTDVVAKQENYKVNDDEKEKGPFELWVLKDVKIYSGPSKKLYKEIGSINKDTKLKVEYRLASYWYYIDYNGTKGYISSEDNAIVYKTDDDNDDMMAIEIIEMMERGTIYDDEKIVDDNVVGKIPANTVIKDIWSVDYIREYYVKYNDVYGFVSEYPFADNCSGSKVKTLGELPLYDNLGESRKKIAKVQKDKEYEVSYCFSSYADAGYYVPELKGWLFNNYSSHNYDEPDPEDVITPRNFVVYTNPKGEVDDPRVDVAILEKVEIKGHPFDFNKEQKNYTIEINKNENKLDFVITPQDENIGVTIKGNENLQNGSVVTLEISDDERNYTYTFNIKVVGNANNVDPPQPEPTPKKDGINLTNEELIMICVGAGVIIAITILVTIKLVNKKKNREETPVQDDTNKES